MARMVKEVDVPVGLKGEMEGTEVRAWCYSGFSLVGGKRKHVPDVHQRMCTRSDGATRERTDAGHSDAPSIIWTKQAPSKGDQRSAQVLKKREPHQAAQEAARRRNKHHPGDCIRAASGCFLAKGRA